MSNDYAYLKRWRYDNARGVRRFLDPAPVRRHVDQLLTTGASKRAIAQKAGVSPGTIKRLYEQQYVRRETAAALLKVTPASLLDRDGHEDFVPAVGARRRIQALFAIGHTASTIAAATGDGACTDHVVYNTLHHPGDWISRLNHDRILAAYAELWDRAGDSTKTRTRARAAGWAPPLAWDDDAIDNPSARPDVGEQLTGPGSTVKRVHVEDVEFLLEAAHLATAQQIAERLGVSRDAVQVACRRAGRSDLLEKLARNARVSAA